MASIVVIPDKRSADLESMPVAVVKQSWRGTKCIGWVDRLHLI